MNAGLPASITRRDLYTLLEVIAHGNLAERSRHDPELVGLFASDSDWMAESEGDAPVIYVIVLVDQSGRSPDVHALKQVLEMLLRYNSSDASFDADAEAIDAALGRRSTRIHSAIGMRRFLCGEKNGVRSIIRARVEIVKQFYDSLKQRLDALERAGHASVPLQRPLMYVGYALRYTQRMRDHDSGDSSFLMQLVRSVCLVRFGSRFHLEHFPVCFLAEQEEAPLGELLITQIADSFSWTGGGFNIHPPGINNSSAEFREHGHAEVRRFWDERRQFRESMGFWDEALEREEEDLDARTSASEAVATDMAGNLPSSHIFYGNQEKKIAAQQRLLSAEQRLLQDAYQACLENVRSCGNKIYDFLDDQNMSLPHVVRDNCRRLVKEWTDSLSGVDDSDIKALIIPEPGASEEVTAPSEPVKPTEEPVSEREPPEQVLISSETAVDTSEV